MPEVSSMLFWISWHLGTVLKRKFQKWILRYVTRLLIPDLPTSFWRRYPAFLYWCLENCQTLNRQLYQIISLKWVFTKSESWENNPCEEHIDTKTIRAKLLHKWTNSSTPNDCPPSSNKQQWTTKVQDICVPDATWLTQTPSMPFSNTV